MIRMNCWARHLTTFKKPRERVRLAQAIDLMTNIIPDE